MHSAPTTTTEPRPRDQWENADLLDYIDGWAAASGLGSSLGSSAFKRDPRREIVFSHPDDSYRDHHNPSKVIQPKRMHTADVLQRMGTRDRIAHREATGI